MSADYQAQQIQLKKEPKKPHKSNRRHQLEDKLAQVMMAELTKLRMTSSALGDEFEFIKTKTRFRFTKDEMLELCQCLSAAIVTCNHLCSITEKRVAERVHKFIIGR